MFFLISVWSIRLPPCFLDRSVGNENSGNANTAGLDRTSASPWTARYVPMPTYPYPRVFNYRLPLQLPNSSTG